MRSDEELYRSTGDVRGEYERLEGKTAWKVREDDTTDDQTTGTPEGRKMAAGVCCYCGQIRMVDVPENFSQDSIDRCAASECTCDAAQRVRRINAKKDQAYFLIDETFNDDTTLGEALKDVVSHMDGTTTGIRSATVIGSSGVKASVALKKDLGIKVTRSETETVSYEI